MTDDEERAGFRVDPLAPEEAQEWRWWRARLREHWWVVPILAGLATATKRLAAGLATLAAIFVAIGWAVRQGWFTP